VKLVPSHSSDRCRRFFCPWRFQSKDRTATSILTLIASAASGDSIAQKQLREFLRSENPNSSYYHFALDWLFSSASQHDPDSQFLLGYLYETGRALSRRDYAIAAQNYRAAVLQGHAGWLWPHKLKPDPKGDLHPPHRVSSFHCSTLSLLWPGPKFIFRLLLIQAGFAVFPVALRAAAKAAGCP